MLGARSKDKTHFHTPGGKREQGESDEQALIWELKEKIKFIDYKNKSDFSIGEGKWWSGLSGNT